MSAVMSQVGSCLGTAMRRVIDPYVALPDVEIPPGRWLTPVPASR